MDTNFPPIAVSTEALLVDLEARLEAETHLLMQRRDALILASGRVPEIVSDEISGKAADYIGQITDFVSKAKDWKDAAKKPVLALDRSIMAQHNNLIASLTSVKETVGKMQTDYLKKKADEELKARLETERLAREAAEQAAAEAQKALEAADSEVDLTLAIKAEEAANEAAKNAAAASVAVAAKPSELGRVTSVHGTTQSLRKKWVHRSVDMATVDLELLRAYLTPADLEKAIKKAIAAERHQIKGVVIEEEYKAR